MENFLGRNAYKWKKSFNVFIFAKFVYKQI